LSAAALTLAQSCDALLRDTRWRVAFKILIWVAALYPLAHLSFLIAFDPLALGANPAETILHVTGDWTLRFLLLSLAITPVRQITQIGGLIRFRRLLGLFSFFYGVLHLGAYIGFDRFFVLSEIGADILKRPFITVGFAALLLMVPLALTSTRRAVMRLGGTQWQKLHRLVYAVAILGVLHFYWLVKRDVTEPLIYALILAALLLFRVIAKQRKTRRTVAP
jgi:methionine sulfoxide reductase heme-binding subunit